MAGMHETMMETQPVLKLPLLLLDRIAAYGASILESKPTTISLFNQYIIVLAGDSCSFSICKKDLIMYIFRHLQIVRITSAEWSPSERGVCTRT